MEKHILRSKTILGLILVTLVNWAPTVGYDFNQADADFIMDNLDKVIIQAGVIFAWYGRMVAQVKLRWK